MNTQKILILGLCGSICLIGGSIFSFYFLPDIVKNQMQKKLELRNGSEMYPMWQNLTVPIQFHAYLFNVTNPDEVHMGEKPIVKEVGPFCYKLFREKIIEEVSSDGNFIIYDSRRTFYESNEDGCVSTEVEVTILNFALMGTVHILLKMNEEMLEVLDEIIPFLFPNIKNIFITSKAKNILFDGIPLNCSASDSTLRFVCRYIKLLAPPQVWKEKNQTDYMFAALHYMNGTSEGLFKVNSGINDLQKVGSIETWNGVTHLPFWLTDECNQIKGTDGYIIAPPEKKSEIYFFQMDVCRSIFLEFEKETRLFDIPARKYIATEKIFQASPNNTCYCLKHIDYETDNETIECLDEGVLNLSPCLKAPVIISWPHFYLASDNYKSYVSGLNPNQSLHENFAYVQRETGVPLSGYKRAQINMFLIQRDDITILNNVSEGLFPVLWIEEGANIPHEYQKMLKNALTLLELSSFIKPFIIITGISIILLAIFMYLRQKQLLCFSINNQIHDMTANDSMSNIFGDNVYSITPSAVANDSAYIINNRSSEVDNYYKARRRVNDLPPISNTHNILLKHNLSFRNVRKL